MQFHSPCRHLILRNDTEHFSELQWMDIKTLGLKSCNHYVFPLPNVTNYDIYTIYASESAWKKSAQKFRILSPLFLLYALQLASNIHQLDGKSASDKVGGWVTDSLKVRVREWVSLQISSQWGKYVGGEFSFLFVVNYGKIDTKSIGSAPPLSQWIKQTRQT